MVRSHDQHGDIKELFPANDHLGEHAEHHDGYLVQQVLSDQPELGFAVEVLDLSPWAEGSELVLVNKATQIGAMLADLSLARSPLAEVG